MLPAHDRERSAVRVLIDMVTDDKPQDFVSAESTSNSVLHVKTSAYRGGKGRPVSQLQKLTVATDSGRTSHVIMRCDILHPARARAVALSALLARCGSNARSLVACWQ